MVRALLEGVALLTVQLIEAAQAVAPIGDTISIDGGLSKSRYFAGFLAAASNRKIRVPAMHELTGARSCKIVRHRLDSRAQRCRGIYTQWVG